MFSRDAVERALDLQRRTYSLLVWMADGVKRGFIRFDTAHEYATLPAAAHAWIERHWNDIPAGARPGKDDLADFCTLFSTYLESSFELVRDPGRHAYSPDAHCFCPMCSWLVEAPHLRARKVAAADKKRARTLKVDLVRALAAERSITLPDRLGERLADRKDLRETLSLAAWTRELLRRLEGQSEGPAVLALWRGFAWNAEGSPRKDVAVTVDDVLGAEAALAALLVQEAQ